VKRMRDHDLSDAVRGSRQAEARRRARGQRVSGLSRLRTSRLGATANHDEERDHARAKFHGRGSYHAAGSRET
jgi:hypothetical protein